MSRYSSVSAFELGVLMRQQQKEEMEMKVRELTIEDEKWDTIMKAVAIPETNTVMIGVYEEDGGVGIELDREKMTWLVNFLNGQLERS